MYIRALSLRDFRSWDALDVTLEPGVTVFVGRNGYGKTNIVEAIGYTAHLGSHRVSQDQPLIRQGCRQAVVACTAVNAGRELTARIAIKAQGANQGQINRTKLKSPRELLGVVSTVLFSPEDLALIRGEPADRRRYLDHIIATRRPRIAGIKADYDKVLRQRNSLLKTAGARLKRGYGSDDGSLATLDVWDAQLAKLGAAVMVARMELAATLAPLVQQAYARIAPSSRPADLGYQPSITLPEMPADAEESTKIELCEAQLLASMGAMRQREIERGISLVGPHRDDLELTLGNAAAKGFASHGETWSMALSLRLAEFWLLRESGTDPVLILDDVFAELDAHRREQLVSITSEAEQVLITAAVGDDLPGNLADARVTRHVVTVEDTESGRVSRLDAE